MVKEVSAERFTARVAGAELLAMTSVSKGVGVVLPPTVEGPLPARVTMETLPSKAPLLVKLPATLKFALALTVPATVR